MPKPAPEPSPMRVHAMLVDGLLNACRSFAVGKEDEFLRWLDSAAERFRREDGESVSFVEQARHVPRHGDPSKQKRDQFLAETVLELIPPGLTPAKRRKAIRRYLHTLERAHADAGAEVPDWIALARQMHLGE